MASRADSLGCNERNLLARTLGVLLMEVSGAGPARLSALGLGKGAVAF